jgi:diaminohydroxyphosphoribosylaminopyrimidine deaminase / 5-amino-6-(5-phosphoribosylamino)uracil reductase
LPMSDTKYMKRAFDLALLAKEYVSPNPMVGCVIVHNERIIGEGYHRKYGGPHAEVNAIHSVKETELLPHSTAYVTLEPCSHYGKTPPCAHVLVEKGIQNVIIANLDPNPLVAGKGVDYLKNNGVRVEIGMLAELGEDQNRRFLKAMRTQMPYVILKWAETADGYIANTDYSPVKISNAIVDIQVHKWRAEEDAILVGIQTALSDNPKLNVRHWPGGKNPKRIIIGDFLDENKHLHVLDDSQETIVFGKIINLKKNEYKQTEFVSLPNEELDLKFVLDYLFKKNIHSILIEGGAKTINAFIKAGFYDEIRQIRNAKLVLHNGIEAPKIPSGIAFLAQTNIEDNILYVYKKTIPTK